MMNISPPPTRAHHKRKIEEVDTQKLLNTPFIFIGFAILCFLTAYYMNGNRDVLVNESVTLSGGEVGPIQVDKKNSVYALYAQHKVGYGKWSYVSAELLDQKKNYLFSFGKEFWEERGYDSDGAWSESDTEMSSKFTIKERGTYYIRLKSENGPYVDSAIRVKIVKKRGSSLPHMVAGIIALIIGVIYYYLKVVPQTGGQSILGGRDEE